MKFYHKLILVIATLLLVGWLFLVDFGNGINEYYSVNWVSKSITEAKTNGAFVRELNIAPKKVTVDTVTVEFRECWIEKQLQLKYSWLFFKEWQPTGKYRLCFTLKDKMQGVPISDYLFVDQKGDAFGINGSGDEEVFFSFIEKDSIGQFRMSLVKSFDEPRTENIVISSQ